MTRKVAAIPLTSCAFTCFGFGVFVCWYAQLIAFTTCPEIICLVVTGVLESIGKNSAVWLAFLLCVFFLPIGLL